MPRQPENLKIYQNIKILYLFILVIFSGLATTFYVSQEGLITLFAITIVFAISLQVTHTFQFFKILLIALGFFLFQSISTNSFYPFYIFRNIALIYITYVIYEFFKDKFFIKLEKIIFFLASVSLIFWAWEVLSPESIINLFSQLNISGELFAERPFYYNLLFYTVDYDSTLILQRNSGFCWEPGPFSIYLILGFFISLSQSKKLNIRTIVYILTILSTSATTGYLALGVLLFFASISKSKGISKYFLALFITAVFTFMFFTLPFMYQKITELFYSGVDVETNYIKISRETGYSYSSGRFGGIIIGLKDLQEFPIFGIGSNSEWSFAKQDFALVNNVSGLGSIASTHGGLGLIIFIYSFFKSSIYTTKLLYNKSSISLGIIFLIAFFSFNFQTQPIIFSILFYYLFTFQKKQTISTSNI